MFRSFMCAGCVFASLFGASLLVGAGPAGAVVAQGPKPPAVAKAPATDAEQDADFADYQQRLFTLIRTFKRYRTTLPDIEAAMGADFAIEDQKGGNVGWLIKASPAYKSLRMNHRVSLYYGEPLRDKPLTQGIYFEAQYYVNFQQADTAMALYTDPARCLTVAAFEGVLTAAKLKYTVKAHPDTGEMLISSGLDTVMKADGIFVLADVYPGTTGYADAAHQRLDETHGCIRMVSVD